ncbi:hypothetical protein V2J09_003839 [Rumex salicifolius]
MQEMRFVSAPDVPVVQSVFPRQKPILIKCPLHNMLSMIRQPLEGLKRMSCKPPLLKATCTTRRKTTVPQVAVFLPTLWIPSKTDLRTPLKAFIPSHLIDHLLALRCHITSLAVHDIVIEGGSAKDELIAALEDYLSVFLGLTNKEMGFQESVEFRWTSLDAGGTNETCITSSRFELLCVVYMLAALTLSEANELLIHMDNSEGFLERIVSSNCERSAVYLLLKAAGYLDFCVKNILAPLDPHKKEKLPAELQEGVLEALKIQAIGQGTEIQLGLAAESQTATLSVKRRLACEVLTYYSQAHFALIGCNFHNKDNLKKHMLFIRWKYLEAKAAAYYYHGLMVDKGFEKQSALCAVSCFLGSKENLLDSKKICLSFFLASPVTRPLPQWGIMKHLHPKIMDIASKKLKAYGYLLTLGLCCCSNNVVNKFKIDNRGLASLPELPQFHLSLRPEEFELPKIDPSWNKQNMEFLTQTLEEKQIEDSQKQNHLHY